MDSGAESAARSTDPGSHAPGSIRPQAGPTLAHVGSADLARALLSRLANPSESRSALREFGLLRALLWRADEGHGNRFSREKCSFALRQLARHPLWSQDRARNATCIELGTGALNPFGSLMPFLALGARRIIALDLEPVVDLAMIGRFAFEQLADIALDPKGYLGPAAPDSAEVLRSIAWMDLPALRRGDTTWAPADRITLINSPADRTDLETDSVDLSVSVSFFEHVPDVESVLAELARVMKPGAIATHTIDGRDHRCYQKDRQHELAFLADPAASALVHGCNRVRPLGFGELFERHGFRVVETKPGRTIQVSDELRSSLVEPFRSMPTEHLETLEATFHIERR